MMICQSFILKVLDRVETVKALPWGDPQTYNEYFLIGALEWYEERLKELSKLFDKDCKEYKERQVWYEQVARLLICEFAYNCFDKENSYKFHDYIFGEDCRKKEEDDYDVISPDEVWKAHEEVAKMIVRKKRSKKVKRSLRRLPVKCMVEINLLNYKFANLNRWFVWHLAWVCFDNKIDPFGNWHTSVWFRWDRDHVIDCNNPDKADWDTRHKLKYAREELRSIERWLEE